jgi:hypothetical protein
MSFYDNINLGLIYFCDRCQVAKLNEFEFLENIIDEYHYCGECWNWLHLKKWKCNQCKASGTLRSERDLLVKICQCGNQLQFFN